MYHVHHPLLLIDLQKKIILNKILCMLTVTVISVLLSSSATSRTRHIGIEYMYKKGGQVTKPIIVVKIPCKLLYQKIKLSVPQLIHTYLFTMLHTISIVNLITLKLNFDKFRPAIFLLLSLQSDTSI